jgi:hypothetical protein
MKNILQDVLKDIEPYQLIAVSIRHDYWTLCREDAEFPLAISVKRLESPSYMFRSSYSLMDMVTPDIAEHYNKYDIDHTIEFDGVKMVIEGEILDIEYHDNYIKIVIKNADNTQVSYINYDSIDFIKVKKDEADNLLESYNKFQYEIANNK